MEEEADRKTPMRSYRTTLAFFLLGMLNNLTFVVNNAGASDILSNAIGVVYLVNIMPELCCKLTAPFWWRLSSYRAKIIFAGLCMCASHLLVLLPGLPPCTHRALLPNPTLP